jgi:acyl dehydratase
MVAFIGQEMSFLRPVFIGDRVTPEHEVQSLRPSRDKPQGRVRFTVRLRDGAQRIVAEGITTIFFECVRELAHEP